MTTVKKIIFLVMFTKLVMFTVPASYYCESDYKERRETRGGRKKRRIRWRKERRTGQGERKDRIEGLGRKKANKKKTQGKEKKRKRKTKLHVALQH